MLTLATHTDVALTDRVKTKIPSVGVDDLISDDFAPVIEWE
jgi:hypothetical protein